MKPIATFILRLKTRPTMEEAVLWSYMRLTQICFESLDEVLSKEQLASECKMVVSNLTKPSEDVREYFHDFIENSGGAKYLENPNSYRVSPYWFETGTPPEPTQMAIVFALSSEEIKGLRADSQSLRDFLERGKRWEQLGRWGDAIHCYQTALEVLPNHPDLLFRLGKIQMGYPEYRAKAFDALRRAVDIAPSRSDIVFALAQCYLLIADAEPFPVKGATREDFRDMAHTRLETAIRLEPKSEIIFEKLQIIRRMLHKSNMNSFFS